MTIQGNGMQLNQVHGDLFSLSRTHQNHLAAPGDDKIAENGDSFAGLLMNSLQSVNSMQNQAAELSVTAALNPDKVDAHDVTLATAKAEMSLNLTKNVVDRVIQGYKDIINLR